MPNDVVTADALSSAEAATVLRIDQLNADELETLAARYGVVVVRTPIDKKLRAPIGAIVKRG